MKRTRAGGLITAMVQYSLRIRHYRWPCLALVDSLNICTFAGVLMFKKYTCQVGSGVLSGQEWIRWRSSINVRNIQECSLIRPHTLSWVRMSENGVTSGMKCVLREDGKIPWKNVPPAPNITGSCEMQTRDPCGEERASVPTTRLWSRYLTSHRPML